MLLYVGTCSYIFTLCCFCGEFVVHAGCAVSCRAFHIVTWGVSLAHSMPFCIASFSYTSCAHSFILGVSLHKQCRVLLLTPRNKTTAKGNKNSNNTLYSTFSLSGLDNCSSLFWDCPEHLQKLQKVRNSAARLVESSLTRPCFTLFRAHHWLPIQQFRARMEYKVSTLCHSFFVRYVILSMCTLHQDSHAPPLTQELNVSHTLRANYVSDLFFLLCRIYQLKAKLVIVYRLSAA